MSWRKIHHMHAARAEVEAGVRKKMLAKEYTKIGDDQFNQD
jgi:hypothetical protein